MRGGIIGDLKHSYSSKESCCKWDLREGGRREVPRVVSLPLLDRRTSRVLVGYDSDLEESKKFMI